MSEELAAPNAWGIEIKKDDSAMLAMQKPQYQPRLQFISKMSKFVEMENGISPNTFAIIHSDDEFKEIGKTVDFTILSWRQKALDTNEGKAYYDNQSKKFIEIQTRAETVQNSGCMFGPEYLVYIPQEGVCATLFMGSKTLRFEVPKLQKFYKEQQPVQMSGKLITPKSGNSKPYMSASAAICPTPILPPAPEKLAEIREIVAKFESAKDPIAESEETVEQPARAR